MFEGFATCELETERGPIHARVGGAGHERFAVAGHDRGGRVGYRMALDHPDRVNALAALDIVPTA
jgi:pimeloyl-ACP methyl ester carboxylesterase